VDKAAAEKASLEKEKAARAARAERTEQTTVAEQQPTSTNIHFQRSYDAEVVVEPRGRSTSGLIYADDLESQTDAGALRGLGKQEPAWSSFLC